MNWEHYQAGRRVVCITEYGGYRATICSVLPVKGQVYTIRALGIGENEAGETIAGLRFVEFQSLRIGDFADTGEEWWFVTKDFRPLDEGRLDQFRQHLVPVSKEGVSV